MKVVIKKESKCTYHDFYILCRWAHTSMFKLMHHFPNHEKGKDMCRRCRLISSGGPFVLNALSRVSPLCKIAASSGKDDFHFESSEAESVTSSVGLVRNHPVCVLTRLKKTEGSICSVQIFVSMFTSRFSSRFPKSRTVFVFTIVRFSKTAWNHHSWLWSHQIT